MEFSDLNEVKYPKEIEEKENETRSIYTPYPEMLMMSDLNVTLSLSLSLSASSQVFEYIIISISIVVVVIEVQYACSRDLLSVTSIQVLKYYTWTTTATIAAVLQNPIPSSLSEYLSLSLSTLTRPFRSTKRRRRTLRSPFQLSIRQAQPTSVPWPSRAIVLSPMITLPITSRDTPVPSIAQEAAPGSNLLPCNLDACAGRRDQLVTDSSGQTCATESAGAGIEDK